MHRAERLTKQEAVRQPIEQPVLRPLTTQPYQLGRVAASAYDVVNKLRSGRPIMSKSSSPPAATARRFHPPPRRGPLVVRTDAARQDMQVLRDCGSPTMVPPNRSPEPQPLHHPCRY